MQCAEQLFILKENICPGARMEAPKTQKAKKEK